MGVEERCLHQLTNNSAPSNNVYQNGCHNCAYDLENNRRCPSYVGVRIITVEVTEKQEEARRD